MKTQSKNKLNVRLLRRVQKHILEEPRRLVMWTTLVRKDEYSGNNFPSDCYGRNQQFAPCGTAACIAGWAVILSGKIKSKNRWVRASRLLGLRGYDQQARLFLESGWPDPFIERYEKATTPKQRAKIAAARIEHLIKTGE